MRKTIFVFVFDGYADWEISRALTEFRQSNCYLIKTIALKKVPIVSLSGMRVIPDIDFFPHIDLKDLDCNNTAMFIFPGGSIWTDDNHSKEDIRLLVAHCMDEHIPLAATGNAALFLAGQNSNLHDNFGTLKLPKVCYMGDYPDVQYPVVIVDRVGNIALSQTISEALNTGDQAYVKMISCCEKHYV